MTRTGLPGRSIDFIAPRGKSFQPRIDCAPGAGNAPPVLGVGGNSHGRYLYLPDQKLCIYRFGFLFSPTGNGNAAGQHTSGFCTYLVELPIPAAFVNSDALAGAPPGQSGFGDEPLGVGWVTQGTTNFGPIAPHVMGSWYVADTPGLKYGLTRQSWASMFVNNAFQYGTGTLTTTSIPVIFPFAFQLTPAIADISVAFTSSTKGALFSGQPWLTGVTPTGFTLHTDVAPTTPATFAWTVNSGVAGINLSDAMPFNVGANGYDAISGQLTYETAI